MTGKILVVDPIPTNRILLKAKLSVTFYDVTATADAAAALDYVAQTGSENSPDLVVLHGNFPDGAALCNALRKGPLPDAAIIACSDQDRAAMLRAGADDVLPGDCPDQVLYARIRSALRVQAERHALMGRLEKSQTSLGPAGQPTGPGAVGLITQRPNRAIAWQAGLAANRGGGIDILDARHVLGRSTGSRRHDVYVIDGDLGRQGTALSLLSDLRARPYGRDVGVIVCLPDADPETIATAYDLGAGTVLSDTTDAEELAARVDALMRRKHQMDRLMKALDEGLALAHTDPLTGLQNRRSGLVSLEANLKGSTPLAVIMADIDHFKWINDTHGHAAGDAVLAAIGAALRKALPKAVTLSRIGGEEFLIVHPAPDQVQALEVAERLRAKVEALEISTAETDLPLHITLSAGVAHGAAGAPPGAPGTEMATLLRLADEQLYRAKNAGRNRVALHGQDLQTAAITERRTGSRAGKSAPNRWCQSAKAQDPGRKGQAETSPGLGPV